MSPARRSVPALTLSSPARAVRSSCALFAAGFLLTAVAIPAQAALVDEPQPGDTVTVDFSFRDGGEQYEWVVPAGVPELTVELAAGSGGAITYDSRDLSVGGPGGHLIATLPVTANATVRILVGAAGAQNDGGEATALALDSEIAAVAGGGGAGWGCALDGLVCASGGAGGYSATSPGPSGTDGQNGSPVVEAPIAGTAGVGAAPGVSASEYEVELLNGVVDSVTIARAGTNPDAGAARVVDGTIQLGAGASGDSFTGGGSGLFGGGHGASVVVTELGDDPASRDYFSGGGGGGSGYLIAGAELLTTADHVGNGFATISYVVPVIDRKLERDNDLEQERIIVPGLEPALELSSAVVRAGDDLHLRGAGFRTERTYPVVLNSDPVLLGEATTDARGAFAVSLTVPASVHAGEHVLTVGEASIPVTILDAAPDTPLEREDEPVLLLAESGPAETAAALGLLAAAMLGLGLFLTGRRVDPLRF